MMLERGRCSLVVASDGLVGIRGVGSVLCHLCGDRLQHLAGGLTPDPAVLCFDRR